MILQIVNYTDHCLKEKIKKFGLMKKELTEKIMTEFAALRPKRNSYVTDENDENKKAKGTKKCVRKRKLQFEDYKQFFKATPLENKINHLEKNNLNMDNLRWNHKEFIKSINLILKSQQRLGIEKRNVFTENVNKT